MCILAWQPFHTVGIVIGPAVKGPIVWGCRDYITAAPGPPAEVFDQGSQVGRSSRGPFPRPALPVKPCSAQLLLPAAPEPPTPGEREGPAPDVPQMSPRPPPAAS